MSTAPVMRAEVGGGDPRQLLVERAAVLLRRVVRVLGRGWTRWRSRTRRRTPVAQSGVLAAMMGRALSPKGGRRRMLSVEERLTLGPKQHMYLIRCGEQRLLVASAGEGALQCMSLPEQNEQQDLEACENTGSVNGRAKTGAKRGAGKSATRRKSTPRSLSRNAASEETR